MTPVTPGELPLLGLTWPEVRESVDAGAYYCAHLLWVGATAALASSDVLRDKAGDPMVGFLHVPTDPWTLLDSGDGAPARHAHTVWVVAAALRGWGEGAGQVRPLRTLVTGFGSFRDVVNNPSGAFVRTASALQAAVARAWPAAPAVPLEDEITSRHGMVAVSSGARRVYARALPVDDSCLAASGSDALRALLADTRAQQWIGLGVARSTHYRVEVRASDVGLDVDGDDPVHESGCEERDSLPINRSLARALVRGAKALDAAGVG